MSESLVQHNRANGWPDLKAKDRAFAIEYLANGFNHNDAAEHVGYSRGRGITLLRDSLVAAYVRHLQDQVEYSAVITTQLIDSMYLRVLPKLMGEDKVPLVLANGSSFQARKFFASETVAVLRDLSKRIGEMPDGEDDLGPVNISFNVKDPVDEVKVTRGRSKPE